MVDEAGGVVGSGGGDEVVFVGVGVAVGVEVFVGVEVAEEVGVRLLLGDFVADGVRY